MRILGLPVPFTGRRQKALSPVTGSGRGWWPIVREPFPGAFQRNVEIKRDLVLSHHAVFSCQTLIASDIAKLRIRLVQRDKHGIWKEVPNNTFRAFVKPNRYQTRLQFYESWVLSKLQHGNAYVLLERNGDRVTGMHVLDPTRVKPLVADNGDVYYDVNADQLAGMPERLIIPARDIIHDRFNCLFHPLVGLSPIFAAGLAAMQGLAIQSDSTLFFQNGAQPGGVLTAPGEIADETAARLKEYWDTNFSGQNAGKVAVLGDGLHYEAMKAKATDSQVIEQLKWSAEVVCGVYHVPAFMVGVGAEPSYNNVQNLTLRYYSQCLQRLIEDIEALLDEAFELNGDVGTGASLGTEFDLDDLLRMDTVAQFDVVQKAKGTATLNEARRRVNLGPVDGGDTIYLQQQDHSLAAIAARDLQAITQATLDTGDVQATALNGAQISALQNLVLAASAGEVPVDAVEAIIAASFPLLTAQQIAEIVEPLKSADNDTPNDDTVARTIKALSVKIAEARHKEPTQPEITAEDKALFMRAALRKELGLAA